MNLENMFMNQFLRISTSVHLRLQNELIQTKNYLKKLDSVNMKMVVGQCILTEGFGNL